MDEIQFHNYKPPINVVRETKKTQSSLLRKRPYDAFYASESSIFPRDETMTDNISDLESSNILSFIIFHMF